MNFLHQGFGTLSSDRPTDRQTDTTKIIYHTASRVVSNYTVYAYSIKTTEAKIHVAKIPFLPHEDFCRGANGAVHRPRKVLKVCGGEQTGAMKNGGACHPRTSQRSGWSGCVAPTRHLCYCYRSLRSIWCVTACVHCWPGEFFPSSEDKDSENDRSAIKWLQDINVSISCA